MTQGFHSWPRCTSRMSMEDSGGRMVWALYLNIKGKDSSLARLSTQLDMSRYNEARTPSCHDVWWALSRNNHHKTLALCLVALGDQRLPNSSSQNPQCGYVFLSSFYRRIEQKCKEITVTSLKAQEEGSNWFAPRGAGKLIAMGSPHNHGHVISKQSRGPGYGEASCPGIGCVFLWPDFGPWNERITAHLHLSFSLLCVRATRWSLSLCYLRVTVMFPIVIYFSLLLAS